LAFFNFTVKVGRGDDNDWLVSISNNATLKKNHHFALPKIRQPTFIVHHFAADVDYSVDGFMEKNMDVLSEQLAMTISEATVRCFCSISRICIFLFLVFFCCEYYRCAHFV
jgi:myosin heavy subunit